MSAPSRALRTGALLLCLSAAIAPLAHAQRKQPPKVPVYRGFYYGAAVGATVPGGDFANSYGTGWHILVPFGWDFRHLAVERAHSQGIFGDSTEYEPGRNPSSEDNIHPGIRLELGYARVSGKVRPLVTTSDAGIYMASGDFKARKSFGQVPANHVYGMVGGTLARVVSSGNPPGSALAPSNNGFATSFSDAATSVGFNAGGGVSLQAGERSTYFLEARYVSLVTNYPTTLLQSPRLVTITLGVTFF